LAWRGVVSLKPGPDGQRRRKKVSGKNKTEVRAKLAELHDELNDGVVTNASYTVAHAIEDWLTDGLAGRAPKTVGTQREVLEPLIDIIGAVPLRELSAPIVRSALKDLAATRATRTVGMTHAGLTRAIRHAEANDKVRRNVATLVDTPAGQEGRPSKSLTFGQAVALIHAARPYGLYAYVVLSLLVGVRTEEARALRWDRVDLEGDPDANPPVPPHVDVWRSVRAPWGHQDQLAPLEQAAKALFTRPLQGCSRPPRCRQPTRLLASPCRTAVRLVPHPAALQRLSLVARKASAAAGTIPARQNDLFGAERTASRQTVTGAHSGGSVRLAPGEG